MINASRINMILYFVQGTGEILEECVSKERQREINRQATQADGDSFQRGVKSRLGVKARLY